MVLLYRNSIYNNVGCNKHLFVCFKFCVFINFIFVFLTSGQDCNSGMQKRIHFRTDMEHSICRPVNNSDVSLGYQFCKNITFILYIIYNVRYNNALYLNRLWKRLIRFNPQRILCPSSGCGNGSVRLEPCTVKTFFLDFRKRVSTLYPQQIAKLFVPGTTPMADKIRCPSSLISVYIFLYIVVVSHMHEIYAPGCV